MKKKIYLLLTLIVSSLAVSAQSDYFKDISENSINIGNNKKTVFPVKYRTVSLDFTGMKNFLRSLPTETNVFNRNQSPVMTLPMPDGSLAKFHVWESSIQEPGLQNKFPDIRTYAGQGIDDRSATIRFDFNPYDGFHAQILSPKGRVYLDPYARGDLDNYISYYQRDNHRNPEFFCEIPQINNLQNRESAVGGILAGACRGSQLYTYRLAVACTGEYAVAVGGTTAPLLHSKIVTTVNRVDGVYETEVAVRLVLIANNNLIEFLNSATDPFTGNSNASTLITESQTQITSLIGSANYDIGHTFSTGAGGLAGLGVVCNTSNKARGVTGNSNPVGDGFDIDYVAHEMGHQFSGNHTFNGSTGSCSGSNRNGSTAYEPGSGTTIQAYAGICGTDNTQPNSDPYFHSVSFDEISTFVEAGGASCRVITSTGNTLPVITAMSNNGANIPINTPFTLTGAATDADGDAITYNWEEWDLGAQGAWNAGATSTTAPLFKSRIPKTSGSRTFPDIAVILAGYPANPATTMGGLKGETLPTVARAMKFRLTVRDNRAAGGGVVTGGNGCMVGFIGTFQVNTITGTGPFIVTAPNGGESFPGTTSQTITWNVAGSSVAPINATSVKISLSTDGGLTYPTVITASTPNDGSEVLTIPNLPTTTARIKVEAVGNIFFDISNSNFTITNAAPGFDFDNPAAISLACSGPTSAAITLGTVSYLGYTTPINLSASGVPSGASVSFSTNPVVPGNSTVVTLNNANTLSNGTYNITITGVSGSITLTRTITYIILAGTGPSIGTQPSNQTICAGANATFSVVTSGTVTSYQWQLSTDGGTIYNNIIGANSASYIVSGTTLSQNNYRYKVIVSGQCNSVTSNTVILTVNPSPAAVIVTPTSSTICSGDSQALSASGGTSVGTANATLGTGTTLTSQTAQPTAFCNRWSQYWNQTVYTVAELLAAGLTTGSGISSITYNTTSQGDANNNTNFSIRIGTTANSVLTAFTTTGLNIVYGPSSYTHVIGLNTITFVTPYTWDGVSNIIIDVRQDGVDQLNNAITYYTAAASNMNIAAITSTLSSTTSLQTLVANATVTPSASVRRLNIILGYSTLQTPAWSWLPATGLNITNAAAVVASPVTTTTYSATATNSFGCTNSGSALINVNNCSTTITVNMKFFLQGYYSGSNTLQPVLNNQGESPLITEADSITVELHHPTTFALIDTKQAVLLTNGTVSATFTQPAGSYYIGIRHRNTLQTWSANTLSCTASTPLYDFTDAASKAMGNNQIQVEPGVWAFFTGDLNQDDFVDGNDFPAFDTDSFNGVNSVYVATDMNGDGFVDGNDFPVFDVNSFNGVLAIHP